MKPLKLAVIGLDLGHPKVFAPLLRESGVEIHSLVSAPTDSALAFVKENSCALLSTPNELWEVVDEIDGLMLANMTCDRHVAARFLERGIPVYFDKHLGTNPVAARALLDTAEKSGAPILSGSVRRFSPAFRAIQDQTRGADFGKAVIVHRFEPYPPTPGSWQDAKETSGGFIVNYGIHCVDSICAVLGDDFESVYCAGGRYCFEEAEGPDSCVITIQYRNGAIGLAELFGAQNPCIATQPSMRVHATRNSVEAYIDEGLHRSFRGKPIYDPKAYSYCSGEEGTVKAIVAMMRTRLQPVPFKELLAVAEILDLATGSYESRQTIFRSEEGIPRE